MSTVHRLHGERRSKQRARQLLERRHGRAAYDASRPRSRAKRRVAKAPHNFGLEFRIHVAWKRLTRVVADFFDCVPRGASVRPFRRDESDVLALAVRRGRRVPVHVEPYLTRFVFVGDLRSAFRATANRRASRPRALAPTARECAFVNFSRRDAKRSPRGSNIRGPTHVTVRLDDKECDNRGQRDAPTRVTQNDGDEARR